MLWDDEINYAGSGADTDILYKNLSGGNWSGTVVISSSSGQSTNPEIAVNALDKAYVTLQYQTNYAGSGTDWDIFYKKLNGNIWPATQVISTESTNFSSYSSIAIGPGDSLYIVRQDKTGYLGSGMDYDIFFKVLDINVPIANASGDQTVGVGITVTFNGLASTDNVAINNYTWSFSYNDSEVILYGVNPSFNFSIIENYTVTLIVTDAASSWDTDVIIMTAKDVIVPVVDDTENIVIIAGAIILPFSFLIVLRFILQRKG